MNSTRRYLAVVDLMLLLPAAIFMAALVLRRLPPVQSGWAPAARNVVLWYAGRGWTLWMLLIVMPLVVLVTGFATLLHDDLQTGLRTAWSMRLVAVETVAAGLILLVVLVHMLVT